MAQALDAAWSRSLHVAETTGRQRQAQADQRVADAWLAGAPVLALSQRQGQGSAADGERETELGVALPLWRFGQRQANARVAGAESDWALAAERVARLGLAAQLREQAGKVRLTEAELRLAAQQRQLLEQLGADVERRVKAGDLAPVDAMAAQADLLGARALEQEAEQALATERSGWALLTGWESLPPQESVAAATESALDQHARILLAQSAAERAGHRVAQLQAQSGGPPELGLGVRQDRPGHGQPRQNSVALSLRLPLGTEVNSQPRLAAALAEQDLALAAQQRLRLQLDVERALAQDHLAASLARSEAERRRAALLQERAQLIEKSFQAGESSLPDLLRALSAAAQAHAAQARQQAAVAQAQARLQQALGQLP